MKQDAGAAEWMDSAGRQGAGRDTSPSGKESSFYHRGDRGVNFFLVPPINSLNQHSGKQTETGVNKHYANEQLLCRRRVTASF